MALTAGELTLARTDAASLLTDSCAISRPTFTPNDSGGGSNNYTTVATVGCRIGPLTSAEVLRGGANTETTDVAVTLPANTDVRAADRLVTGGRTYEVTGITDRTDELLRRVSARESV